MEVRWFGFVDIMNSVHRWWHVLFEVAACFCNGYFLNGGKRAASSTVYLCNG